MARFIGRNDQCSSAATIAVAMKLSRRIDPTRCIAAGTDFPKRRAWLSMPLNPLVNCNVHLS
jgi:hypothetical protein